MTILAVLGIATIIAFAIWLDDKAAQRCYCGALKARNERFCATCEAEVAEWLA